MHVEPSLISMTKTAQDGDGDLWYLIQNMKAGKQLELRIDDQGIVWMDNRLCVPNNKERREEVMEETHRSLFSIHPVEQTLLELLLWSFRLYYLV